MTLYCRLAGPIRKLQASQVVVGKTDLAHGYALHHRIVAGICKE